ncbi:hypothetical protein ACFL08_00760 [Patescibacteria group bacterium]
MTFEERIEKLKGAMIVDNSNFVSGEKYFIVGVEINQYSKRKTVDVNRMHGSIFHCYEGEPSKVLIEAVSGLPRRVFRYNEELFKIAKGLFDRIDFLGNFDNFWSLIEESDQFSNRHQLLGKIEDVNFKVCCRRGDRVFSLKHTG